MIRQNNTKQRELAYAKDDVNEAVRTLYWKLAKVAACVDEATKNDSIIDIDFYNLESCLPELTEAYADYKKTIKKHS